MYFDSGWMEWSRLKVAMHLLYRYNCRLSIKSTRSMTLTRLLSFAISECFWGCGGRSNGVRSKGSRQAPTSLENFGTFGVTSPVTLSSLSPKTELLPRH